MVEFLEHMEEFINNFATMSAYIIEIMGIVVVILGAIRAFILYFINPVTKKRYNVKIELGDALALGLEFKMGAEILKTVVLRTKEELIILGAIILLRAILAVLIHWEVQNEKKEANGEEPERLSSRIKNFFKRKKEEPLKEVPAKEEVSSEASKSE